MTATVIYLDVQRVLRLHDMVIRQTGGDSAVLDSNLLESAVAQPAMSCFGQEAHPDVHSKAAAYLFHLCKNHPFADGNKRTAYAVAEVFLRMNGFRIDETVETLEQFVLSVADGTLSKAEVVEWFRSHARQHQ